MKKMNKQIVLVLLIAFIGLNDIRISQQCFIDLPIIPESTTTTQNGTTLLYQF
jgi:hypothetical protein